MTIKKTFDALSLSPIALPPDYPQPAHPTGLTRDAVDALTPAQGIDAEPLYCQNVARFLRELVAPPPVEDIRVHATNPNAYYMRVPVFGGIPDEDGLQLRHAQRFMVERHKTDAGEPYQIVNAD